VRTVMQKRFMLQELSQDRGGFGLRGDFCAS
jgi:hypothetical protein